MRKVFHTAVGKRVIGVTLAMAILFPLAGCGSSADEASAPSLDRIAKIAAAAREARNKIESARIIVRTTTTSEASRDQLFEHSSQIVLPNNTTEFVFHGDKRYLKQTTPVNPNDAKYPPGSRRTVAIVPGAEKVLGEEAIEELLKKANAPARERIEERVFDGEKAYSIRTGIAEVASTASFAERPPCLFGLPYLGLSHWFLFDPTGPDESNAHNKRYLFPDLLEADGVSTSFVQRDGKQMLQVEWTPPEDPQFTQKMWFDSSVGWAMAFCEVYGNSRLLACIECSDFQQIHEGFWVPQTIKGAQFAPASAVEQHGADRPWVVTTYEATITDVNKVDNQIFAARLQPGTIVCDRDARPGEPNFLTVGKDGTLPKRR